MLRSVQYFGIFVVLLFFAVACSGPNYAGNQYDPDIPDGPDSNPSPDPIGLAAPGSVTASFSGGGISVQWAQVADATGYGVFRKDGSSEFISIGTTPGLSLSDTSYPKDDSVQYAIKSVSGATISALSVASASLTESVSGLSASVLKYSDKVRISWNNQAGHEQYILYRGTDADGPFNTVIGTYPNSTSECGDTSAAAEIPYYYQLRWQKNGYTYGASTHPIMGICSSADNTDDWESNNNKGEASSVGSEEVEASTYWYSNDDYDIDWYQFTGHVNDSIQVEITEFLLIDTIELSIDIYNDQNEILSSELIDSIPFNSEFHSIPDSGSLYFKIYPISGSSDDPIGLYTFTIGNAL